MGRNTLKTMLRSLDFYIIREFWKKLLPIWAGLGLMLYLLEWLAQVFRIKVSAFTVLEIYFYKMPSHLVLVFPLSALIASLIVFGAMNKDRELVAAESLGYSKGRMLGAAGVAILLATIPYFLVSMWIAPVSFRAHLMTMETKVHGRPATVFSPRQEKIWYRSRDVLYNIDFFDFQNNELNGVVIYSFDNNFQLSQILRATRAKYDEKGGFWNLLNGSVSLVDRNFVTPVMRPFEERRTFLLGGPEKLQSVDFNPQAMTQFELGRLIDKHKELGMNTKDREVVYHSRWSFLAVAFVFLILAVPRVMRFERVSGVSRDVIFAVVIGLSFWAIFNFGVNLGNKGNIPPMLAAWIPPLFFASYGLLRLRSGRA